ncbi:MAG: hypothetical protein OEZ06_28805 [Myxococcales bacterium]|nr:hypothetical protein [Myxococcales bacterium]
MGRILAVAVNTFREAVRDRVLYGVVGIATAVLLFTLVLAELSLDQHLRVVLDVGLASISFFSVLVAIFLGSSLLYKEIERKTLYVILPKPIHRYEFLLGKYCGITLTATVFVAIMGAVQLGVTTLQAGGRAVWVLAAALGLPVLLALWVYRARDRTAVVVPWSMLALLTLSLIASQADVALWPILAALGLNVAEVLVLTAVALFFSSFSTPFLTALFTAGVWLVGRSADTMTGIKSDAIPQAVKDLLAQLVKVWPNFNLFVPGRRALEVPLSESVGPLSYVVNNAIYAGCYAAIVLALAALIFQRRDFL